MKTTISKIALSTLFVIIITVSSFAQDFLIISNEYQTHGPTGNVVDLVIPYDIGEYDAITFYVSGADGGAAQAGSSCISYGGDGADVYITCFVGEEDNHLPPGTPLRFIVGESGTNGSTTGTNATRGGGGGGSGLLAWLDGQWEIIAAAGGGGGAYQGNIFGACIDSQNGQGGRASTSGGGGSGDIPGSGGSDGNGGSGGGATEDLSGGGGGAFSNGTGGVCMEGKSGFPDGGNQGCAGTLGFSGGWGFGGGGGGDESPGGGGGYSGGGGGGLTNNGGGGGSYVNDNFALTSSITAGGSTEGTFHGAIAYRFRQPCVPTIRNVEVSEPICELGDQATVKVHWDATYSDCSKDDFNIVFHSVESNEDIGPTEITEHYTYTQIETGNYTIQAFDNNGFLFYTEHLSLDAQDITPPEALCKDATVQLTDGTYEGDDLANQIDNGSSDNCSAVSLTADPTTFDCSDVGENVVLLYAVDENDNVTFCLATVTVEASEGGGPVAICKPAFTVELTDTETSVPSINNGSYFEDCDANPIYQTPQTFDCDDLGDNIVTLSLTDDAGQNSTCTTVVTLEDVRAPGLFCKNQIAPVILDENGSGSISYSNIVNFALDFCTSVTPIGVSPNTFSCSDVGEQMVTASAMDEAGNVGTCVRTVTVVDNVGLTALCNNLIVNLDEVTIKTITIDQLDRGSNALCNFTLSASQTTFDCSDIGTNTVLLTATTGGGSQSTCAATVTVRDVNPPIVVCQEVTVDLNINGSISIDANTVTSLITDNCSVASSQLLGNASFTCTDIGEHSVTVNVTDNSGEANSCIAHVTIADNSAPDAICQDLTIQLDQNGSAVITTQQVDNGSTDNCGINNLSLDLTSFNCEDVGIAQSTLTVTDDNGNSSTCVANITVEDNIVPVALCQDRTMQLDENGNTTVTAAVIDNGTYDVCGINALTLDRNTFDCEDIGSQSVTLTAMDTNGNTSTCSASVTVEDTTAPSVICNDLTINLTDQNSHTITQANIETITQSSTDNCGGLSTSSSATLISYDCDDIGSDFIIILAVTDASNNFNTCTATVSIADPNSVCNAPPVAICQDITISVDDNCEATITANQIDNGSSDPDFDELIYSVDNEGPFGPGAYEINLTVDDGEYTSSCSATITVIDDTVPTIDCPADQTFNTDAGSCASTFTVPVPTADDNCEVSVLRHRYRAVDELGNNISGENWSSWSTSATRTLDIGHWKIQWQAKDPSNNQKKCAFFVDIIDGEAPVPVCLHPTITFNGETSIDVSMNEVWDEAASSDNCGDVFFIDQSAFQITCDQIGNTVPITITVEDAAGNTANCTANVLVGGLPCGWEVDPAGLGCAAGTGTYDGATAVFDLTSAGCYDASYYRQNDQHGFIQQSLCGDGEIIARVASVTGSGWAGISMRESNDPSAPMIQLMIDGTSLSRRELRQTAGSYAFTQIYPTQGKNWLRLSRTGNQFTASRSEDGVVWDHVFITQIPMSNCIEIGLITMNGVPTEEITGTFANVSINGATGSNLQASTPPTTEQWNNETIEPWNNESIKLFPNPATEVVNLQLEHFIDKDVQVSIYNQLGQIVLQRQWQEVSNATEQININNLPPGTYIVEIRSGSERVAKKLVVARM